MTNERSHLRTVMNQDGAVILDTKLGKISTLNTTGGRIWQALERGETVEMIAASLAGETGERMDAVERDVRGFVEALKDAQLLPC